MWKNNVTSSLILSSHWLYWLVSWNEAGTVKIIHTDHFHFNHLYKKHDACDKMFIIVIASDYYNVRVLVDLWSSLYKHGVNQQLEFLGGQTHNQGVGLDTGHCTVGLGLQQGHT